MIAFERALEARRIEDAAMIESSGLRIENAPSLYSLYAIEGAILDHSPAADGQLRELRKALETRKETQLLALLDGVEGRLDEPALLRALDGEADVTFLAHAWFALGVNAERRGDHAKAARHFEHAAARALDRAFPYRLATKLARGEWGARAAG